MAQVEDRLPSRHEAWSSNPNTIKNKKQLTDSMYAYQNSSDLFFFF
jgi:hypothetical protein